MSSPDDIVAASVALSASTVDSAEDYDRQIHRHLTFLRRTLSKQELSSFLINEGILNVNKNIRGFSSLYEQLH